MKNQSKQFVILTVGLILALGALLVIRQYNHKQEDSETETVQMLFDVAESEVSRVIYDYEDVTYTFVKKDESWYYEADMSMKLDQNKMSSMVKMLSEMEVVQTIDNVADWEQYGLSKEYGTLQYESSNGNGELYVGNYNEILGVYYVKKPSEDILYTVPAQKINGFRRTPDDLKANEESVSGS